MESPFYSSAQRASLSSTSGPALQRRVLGFMAPLCFNHWRNLNEGGVRKPTGRVYAGSAVALLLHLYLTLAAKMADSIAKTFLKTGLSI